MRKVKRTSLVVLLFVMLSFNVFALSITNQQVQQVSNRYAIINWMTDIPSSSTVLYGTNQTMMTQSVSSSQLVTNHTVMISPLQNSTTYFFNVTSINDTYSVSTSPVNLTTTATDTIPPFINTQIPDYYGSTAISIPVQTEPQTQVAIFVNGNITNYDTSGNDGFLPFSAVRLDAGNGTAIDTILIIAKDPSGNQNQLTKTIIVDTSPPAILFPPLPSAYGQNSLTINGTTNKPVIMDIIINQNLTTVLNVTGSTWKTTITFPNDAKYLVELKAVDRAGNIFDQTFTVQVDTQPLILTSNAANLNPSYTLERTITGTVNKPYATIMVFINNKTASDITRSTSGGLIDVPTSISELIQRAQSGTLNGNHLNYITTADANGNFKVNVEFTTNMPLTNNNTQVYIPGQATPLSFVSGQTWVNTLEVVAIDETGRNVSSGVQTIYYTQCGSGGLYAISSPVPSPTSIPVSLLKQGFGEFGLTLGLTWVGSSDVSKVTMGPVNIGLQPISQEDRLNKYNLTLGTMQLYNTATIYPTHPVGTTKELYALVQLNPTGANITSTNILSLTELDFPLLLTMQYSYPLPNGQMTTVNQQTCIDTSIDIEPTTNAYLPPVLLKTLIDVITGVTKAIKGVLDYSQPAQTWDTYACLAGTLVTWIDKAVTVTGCTIDGVPGGDITKALQSGVCSLNYDSGSPVCTCSDNKFQTCCNSVIDAMNVQGTAFNFFCDRIMCPSVPSLANHGKTYADMLVQAAGGTGTQLSTTGAPVQSASTTASSGSSVTPKPNAAGSWCGTKELDTAGVPLPQFSSGCKSEFNRAWGTAVLFPQPASSVFDIALNDQKNRGDSQDLLTSISNIGQQTVSDVCASRPPSQVFIKQYNGNKAFMMYPSLYPTGYKDPANINYHFVTDKNKDTILDYGTVQEVKSYSGGQGKQFQQSGTDIVFTVQDQDLDYSSDGTCADATCNKDISGLDNYNGKQQSKLPPEVIAQMGAMYSKDYVYNPTAGIIAATKSVCIPAFNGYLLHYNQVLTSVKNCFQSIISNGQGSSSVCNSLLSSVVCDVVIDAVQCTGSALGNWAQHSTGVGENTNVFASIVNAGSSMTSTISNRYGNTAAYTALFSQNKLINSICIGAFTGDWNLQGMSSLLTQAENPPLDSTCAIVFPTRRYMTADPTQQGRPTYYYSVPAMLAAGADITSYSLVLVCSDSPTGCAQFTSQSNPNGECDCTGQGEKTTGVNVALPTLHQGDTFDNTGNQLIAAEQYRYDSARLTYTYVDSMGKSITKSCSEPIHQEGGDAPNTCAWTPVLGFRCAFDTSGLGSVTFVGTPTATKVPPLVYHSGDTLGVTMTTQVIPPSSSSTMPGFVKIIVTDKDKNQEITPLDYTNRIDDGLTTNTWPGLVINQADFSTLNTTLFTPQSNSGAPPIVTGSQSIAQGTSTTSLIVTFTSSGYICNAAGLDKNGVVSFGTVGVGQGTAITPDNVNGNVITCGGVSFRILPSTTNRIVAGAPALGPLASYPGTYYYVTYTPTTAQQTICDSTQHNWNLQITLYYAQGDPSNPSSIQIGNPVLNPDGSVAQVNIPVVTVCSPLTNAQTTTGPFSLYSFIPSTTNVNLITNSKMTISYNIQENTGVGIKDTTLLLRNVVNSAPVVYSIDLNAASSAISNQQIDLNSAGVITNQNPYALVLNVTGTDNIEHDLPLSNTLTVSN